MRWSEIQKKDYIFVEGKVLKAHLPSCHWKFNKEVQHEKRKIPNQICQTIARRDKMDVSKSDLLLMSPQCFCLGKMNAFIEPYTADTHLESTFRTKSIL